MYEMKTELLHSLWKGSGIKMGHLQNLYEKYRNHRQDHTVSYPALIPSFPSPTSSVYGERRCFKSSVQMIATERYEGD